MPGPGQINTSNRDANCFGFGKLHRRDFSVGNDDNPFRDMDSHDWYIAITILSMLVGFLVIVMVADMYLKHKQGELKRELWGIFRCIFIAPFVGLYNLIFRIIPGFFLSIPDRCAAWKADREFEKQLRALKAGDAANEKGKDSTASAEQGQQQEQEQDHRLAPQTSTDAAHDEFMRNFGDVPIKDTPKWNIYQKVMARRAMKARDVESQ